MTEVAKRDTAPDSALELSPKLMAMFTSMAVSIPDENENAYESIVSQIIGSTDWDQLDAPWETSDIAQLQGVTLRIDRLARRPSDIGGGLGFFLVVHATAVRTGEVHVITTGSVAVVAQLARAHMAGWLPLYAQFVIAERATANGFRPHHLKILGRPGQASQEKAPA